MQNANPGIKIIPIILMTITFVVLSYHVAKRKGKSPGLFFLLSFIPFINLFLFIYLISLTDKSVLDKLDLIMEIVDKKNE